MENKKLARTVSMFMSVIIVLGLLLVALPFFQYRAFMASCMESKDEMYCKGLWIMAVQK